MSANHNRGVNVLGRDITHLSRSLPMRPYLLALVAVSVTLVCGFSYRDAGAADDKVKTPEPTGSIQAEVKGTFVCKGIGHPTYVSVLHQAGEETRVWFWESEGRWKALRDVLPKLDGQEVTVRGQIRQLPDKHHTSIPDQALYFRSWAIQTKAGAKIR
jgi:hypothetical protein